MCVQHVGGSVQKWVCLLLAIGARSSAVQPECINGFFGVENVGGQFHSTSNWALLPNWSCLHFFGALLFCNDFGWLLKIGLNWGIDFRAPLALFP